MCKENLLSCFNAFIFYKQICHLWLLRVSDVASEALICGI